jgi:hypothetical protein
MDNLKSEQFSTNHGTGTNVRNAAGTGFNARNANVGTDTNVRNAAGTGYNARNADGTDLNVNTDTKLSDLSDADVGNVIPTDHSGRTAVDAGYIAAVNAFVNLQPVLDLAARDADVNAALKKVSVEQATRQVA